MAGWSRIQYERRMKEHSELKAEIAELQKQARELAQKALHESSKELEDFYKEEAENIAKKYAVTFPPEEQQTVFNAMIGPLADEGKRLAFFYENQFGQGVKQFVGKWAMFSRNIAMGSMTMGDVWHQMWANIWSLLFGPWVIGSFFVFLQFLLITNYVPTTAAKPFLVIMAPIIGGGGVFLLNFMNSKNPMDWLTHLVTGVIIAYAAGMFWVAIFGNITNFPGGVIWFWITWFLSGVFIGAFQLYQLGGFRAVMQFAVLILLFSYLALGPYQASYRQAIDRIKEPFTLAFRAVITAFNDAWVLATNPTEWYARQQLRNVRTEKPLEIPKGVEITRLESLTPGVGIPAGEEFEVFGVIENRGRLDARNVIAKIECNEFCKVEKGKEIIDSSKISGLATLEQGRQMQLRFQGLKAADKLENKAAYEIAKVTLFVSYLYETNSTLPVTIASEAEIDRKFANKEDVFKPITSIAMEGPGELSLNVGPQPLKENDGASLLTAILNARPDGVIVLKPNDKLLIDLPDSIGTISDNACRSGSGSIVCLTGTDANTFCSSITDEDENGNRKGAKQLEQNCLNNGCGFESGQCKNIHTLLCNILPKETKRTTLGKVLFPIPGSIKLPGTTRTVDAEELRIKAKDFSTILPLFCSFTAKSADVFKSDRIKASLPGYIFEINKKLEVTITQPLGIAKAPSSATPTPIPTSTVTPTPTPAPTSGAIQTV